MTTWEEILRHYKLFVVGGGNPRFFLAVNEDEAKKRYPDSREVTEGRDANSVRSVPGDVESRADTTCDPAIDKLLSKPDIASVLVVGVHTGKEAQRFIDAGKQVTGVDLLPPYRNGYTHIRGRFEDLDLPRFDCAVSSHVLEHQENVGATLRKFQSVVKRGGWLGVVVPGYPQDEFFVGHLTLWSPALLLYNLAANGWDCRQAEYYTTPDRHHIGVVVPNYPIPGMPADKGWDIWGGLKTYLPVEFKHKMNAWLPDRWS